MESGSMLPTNSPVSLPPPKRVNFKNKELIRTKGISATSNLMNFLCGMLGPGCFSVAMSFKQAGLWTGLILMVVMGMLSLLSMYKIIQCSQYLAKILDDQSLDYGEMTREAFRHSFKCTRPYAKSAQIFVNFCLMAFQLGVLSVCYVFVADHLQEILLYFFPSFFLSINQLILLYFVFLLILNLAGNIRFITFLSLFGNIIIFLCIALITKELISHEHYPTTSLPAFTNFQGVSLAAGALIYAFEGQAMVLPLENKLKYPSDMIGWNGVLTTAMNLVTIIYIFIGFFGYITFGDDVAGSLTLNLPNTIFSVIVKMLLVGKIYIGSSLQIFVIVEMILPPLKRNYLKKDSFLIECSIRIIITFISLVTALSLPNLYDIIPIVGISSGMCLSFIIPSIIDSILFLPDPSYSFSSKIMRLITNIILFLVGFICMTTGLYSTISNLI